MSVLYAVLLGVGLSIVFYGIREIVMARRANRPKSDLKELEELRRQLGDVDKDKKRK